MSIIAFVHYEASTLRFYQETSTVSIISEQPSYSDLLSKVGEKSFQEYVSEGTSHPVFNGDLVYKKEGQM